MNHIHLETLNLKKVNNIMLFVTVYGSELASLYAFIHQQTKIRGSVTREQLYGFFVPHDGIPSKGQTKNIDDGLNYLRTVGLISGDSEYCCCETTELPIEPPFAIRLLYRFQQIEQTFPQCAKLDYLYIILLKQLYILPNIVWIENVHSAANRLDVAKQIGGVSIEKIGAWKRVMEFLGLGYRVGNGFYCQYRPEVLDGIIRQWMKKEGTLQEFFERHLQMWLPCLTATGDLAHAVAPTLEFLELQGKLHLVRKQDSPARPYFGPRYLRGIEIL